MRRPKVPSDNKGIYCRSWCPLHPDVNSVVFALIDELADAFEADAFHVGMDEVFLVASDQCPRCRGKHPAEVFAKAVNDLHAHIVGEKKLTMLMWADRLIDGKATTMASGKPRRTAPRRRSTGFPRTSSSATGTTRSAIIIRRCPISRRRDSGCWPASWRNPKAALALLEEASAGEQGPGDRPSWERPGAARQPSGKALLEPRPAQAAQGDAAGRCTDRPTRFEPA